MAPNLKPAFMTFDNELLTVDDVDQAKLTEMLDKQADTDGLKNINGNSEDWTDVKHSERKKRDRVLDGKHHPLGAQSSETQVFEDFLLKQLTLVHLHLRWSPDQTHGQV